MQNFTTVMSVDLKPWVFGTIKKVKRGSDWNRAWRETYHSIGGTSLESGKKVCPKAGVKTLYLLGRIKGGDMPYRNPPLREVWEDYSKNGAYSILALEGLSQNHNISLTDLWRYIQNRIRKELREEPAASNQGALTVAFKLWHLGLILNQ